MAREKMDARYRRNDLSIESVERAPIHETLLVGTRRSANWIVVPEVYQTLPHCRCREPINTLGIIGIRMNTKIRS